MIDQILPMPTKFVTLMGTQTPVSLPVIQIAISTINKTWWMTWSLTSHTSTQQNDKIWWRHQMETFSVLLVLCAGNSPEFPSQRPVVRSFDVFFDLRLNKRLSKTPSGRWWRHCNVIIDYYAVSWWIQRIDLSGGSDLIAMLLFKKRADNTRFM